MTYKDGHLLEVFYCRGDVEIYVKQSDERMDCVEFKISISDWQDHRGSYSTEILKSSEVEEIIDHGSACEEIRALLL